MAEGEREPDGPEVVVVGSIHQDLILEVDRFPAPGETVLARGHVRAPGGKGANQAVAAARLGARTAMVGQVGDDPDGAAMRSRLATEHLDIGGVLVHPSLPTGTAAVTVDVHGENSIVASAGASGALTAEDVRRQAGSIDAAKVTLLQLEIDLDAVIAAAEVATGTVVLNPAPVRHLPMSLLEQVDVLVPNRGELSQLLEHDEVPASLAEVESLARKLPIAGSVVVTLGGDGALVLTDGEATHVPAPKVEVIDTTGAGDALCGALAQQLAAGVDLTAAVERAVQAAALSTTRMGAQTALPDRAELQALQR